MEQKLFCSFFGINNNQSNIGRIMKKITVIFFILLSFSVYSKDINEIKNQINKNQIFSWEIKEKVKLKVNMDLNLFGSNSPTACGVIF